MNKLVIVLTKYPETGKVKTRLAKDIGFEKSTKIQKLFIENILKNNYFRKNSEYDFKIYLKEKEKIEDFIKMFGIKKEDVFSPEGENLGEVMNSIFEKSLVKYKEVILIGSDIPLLKSEDFLKAFEILKNKDFVLGPALDGGYYLIGMKKLNSYVFEDIIFSTNTVLDETIFKIQNNGDSFGLLEQKRDIDELNDIIEEEKIDKTGFFENIVNLIKEK